MRIQFKNLFQWSSLKRIAGAPAVRYTALTPILGFLLLWSNQLELMLQPLAPIATIFKNAETYFPSFIFSNTVVNTILNIYFGLVLTGFGYIAYLWFCPLPIQNYLDRQDFVKRESELVTPQQLARLRETWLPTASSASSAQTDTPKRAGSIDLHMGIQHSNADWLKAEFADIVDVLAACYDTANVRFVVARLSIGFLFLLGVIFSSLPALRTLWRIFWTYVLAK